MAALPQSNTTMKKQKQQPQPDADGWLPHVPGDPMPCDAEMRVDVKLGYGGGNCFGTKARHLMWHKMVNNHADIIAWRPHRSTETSATQATPPKMIQRIESILLLPPGEPVFSEAAMRISIVDEAAGEFLELESLADGGKFRLDPDEWPEFKAAVEMMLEQIEKHDKPVNG